MTTHRVFTPQLLSPMRIIEKKIMPLIYQSTKMKSFHQIDMALETRKFLIKIARGKKERKQSHDLRRRVFASDFIGEDQALSSDWDRYDRKADFLIIIDKEKNDVVGSYRLIRSLKAKNFYTSSEFFINHFVASPDLKVELSRACVAPEYRKGSVVLLLWKGIHHYLVQAKADILFGCSSLSNTGALDTLEVIRFLDKEGHTCHNSWNLRAKYNFDCNQNLLTNISGLASTSPESLKLPPLFKSYLKVGAKVISVPAYDPHYRCYDFFTILRVKDLNDVMSRKLQFN